MLGSVLILLIAGTAAFGDEAPGGSGPETREISLEIAEGKRGFSRGQLEDRLLALPGVEDVGLRRSIDAASTLKYE